MNTKLILMTIIMSLCTIAVVAQSGKMSKESRERIESQRVAFITQKLDLTPDEATRFWPIYNEYKNELKEMRKNFERPDMESLTEEEAAMLIKKQMDQEQHQLGLKAKMLTDLSTAVSAKKALMLQRVENMFNKELLRKLQERRKQ